MGAVTQAILYPKQINIYLTHRLHFQLVLFISDIQTIILFSIHFNKIKKYLDVMLTILHPNIFMITIKKKKKKVVPT